MHPQATRVPLLHVRPARGWLNDPNGIVRHRGRWHVFYQHNPLRAQHGSIAWAHVSSADLVGWTQHPIAFSPSPGAPDAAGCWSGTSLPWLDSPAVVYTGLVDVPEDSTVCLRTALDDELETWSAPVVVAHQPEGVGVLAMRDPFPFEWQGRRFALLGAAMTDGSASLLLYSCEDPGAWRFERVWLSPQDELLARVAPADIWECPQLARVGDEAVLVLSLQTDRRLEDVVHVVGRLEDEAGLPRFVPASGGRFDHGPDFYAPHLVQDGEAAPLLLGWIRQDDAADDAPEDAVAGCLTFPRRLTLVDGQVVVCPDPALRALVGPASVVPQDRLQDGRLPLPERSRVELRGSADLALVAGDVRVELAAQACEVWVDGPVAEVFRPGGVASTARTTGADAWCLEGDLGGCAVAVSALSLPG